VEPAQSVPSRMESKACLIRGRASFGENRGLAGALDGYCVSHGSHYAQTDLVHALPLGRVKIGRKEGAIRIASGPRSVQISGSGDNLILGKEREAVAGLDELLTDWIVSQMNCEDVEHTCPLGRMCIFQMGGQGSRISEKAPWMP